MPFGKASLVSKHPLSGTLQAIAQNEATTRKGLDTLLEEERNAMLEE